MHSLVFVFLLYLFAFCICVCVSFVFVFVFHKYWCYSNAYLDICVQTVCQVQSKQRHDCKYIYLVYISAQTCYNTNARYYPSKDTNICDPWRTQIFLQAIFGGVSPERCNTFDDNILNKHLPSSHLISISVNTFNKHLHHHI